MARLLYSASTGGFSICKSPDRMIGRGACCHIDGTSIKNGFVVKGEKQTPLTSNQIAGLRRQSEEISIALDSEDYELKIGFSKSASTSLVIRDLGKHKEMGLIKAEMDSTVRSQSPPPEFAFPIVKYSDNKEELERTKRILEEMTNPSRSDINIPSEDIIYCDAPDIHLGNVEYKIARIKGEGIEKALRAKAVRLKGYEMVKTLYGEQLERQIANPKSKIFEAERDVKAVTRIVRSVDSKTVVSLDIYGKDIEGTVHEVIHSPQKGPFHLTALIKGDMSEYPRELNKCIAGKNSSLLTRINKGNIGDAKKVFIWCNGITSIVSSKQSERFTVRGAKYFILSCTTEGKQEKFYKALVEINERKEATKRIATILPGEVDKIKASQEFTVKVNGFGCFAYTERVK